MADSNDAAAAVAKLHLDDATGEMVSKTELKKRQKAREKDAARKERQAAHPPPAAAAASARSAEAAEKELTPNQVCPGLGLGLAPRPVPPPRLTARTTVL